MSRFPLYSEFITQGYVEGTWLHGAIITAVLYGVVVDMSIMCLRSLWPRIRLHDTGYRKNIFLFCYVTFLFVLGTIYMAFIAEMAHRALVSNPEGVCEL